MDEPMWLKKHFSHRLYIFLIYIYSQFSVTVYTLLMDTIYLSSSTQVTEGTVFKKHMVHEYCKLFQGYCLSAGPCYIDSDCPKQNMKCRYWYKNLKLLDKTKTKTLTFFLLPDKEPVPSQTFDVLKWILTSLLTIVFKKERDKQTLNNTNYKQRKKH